MIHSVKLFFGKPIRAADGEIGSIFDLYFSDINWDIKYFVVEIDGWTFDKRVLIEPKLLFIGNRGNIHTPLTNSGIWHCHDYDTQKPVSRLMEEKAQYSVWRTG
jgi:hypothetical protein